MTTLNDQGNSEHIRNYIQQLDVSYQISEQTHVSDHPLLNSILLQYMQCCKDKKIRFYTDIRSDCIQFLSDNDITTIFCNVLDNAIEASQHTSHAFIECTVSKQENVPLTVIVVLNSCSTTPIHNQHSLLTHKSDQKTHGLGLKSVQHSIDHYNGQMTYYYEEQRQVFHTIITLEQPI